MRFTFKCQTCLVLNEFKVVEVRLVLNEFKVLEVRSELREEEKIIDSAHSFH